MLQAFGDESYDSHSERVFAVAAICGTREAWDRLVDQWRTLLDDKVFHATDCESDRGAFAGSPHADNLALYRDLTTVLAASDLFGYGVSIDMAAFRTHFADVLKETAYYKTFMEVVRSFAQFAYQLQPRESVKFTFERRIEAEVSAAALYRYWATFHEWDEHVALDPELSFGDKSQIELQVADLFAREVMKMHISALAFEAEHGEDYNGPEIPRVRKSLQALVDTGRFKITALQAGYVKGWKESIPAMQEAAGTSREKYAEWLRNAKCPDTMENRLRFQIQIDREQRANGGLLGM